MTNTAVVSVIEVPHRWSVAIGQAVVTERGPT